MANGDAPFLSEADADREIGEAVLAARFFQKPPSDDQKRTVGRDWFEKNKAAVRSWCKEHPDLFSSSSEKRHEIISLLGDIVLVGTIGIPLLSLLSKIFHYGHDRLMEEKDEPTN